MGVVPSSSAERSAARIPFCWCCEVGIGNDLGVSRCVSRSRVDRQQQMKAAAGQASHILAFTFDPDAAAMRLNDAMHHGEAQAQPAAHERVVAGGEGGRVFSDMEFVKDAFLFGPIDADPGVADDD